MQQKKSMIDVAKTLETPLEFHSESRSFSRDSQTSGPAANSTCTGYLHPGGVGPVSGTIYTELDGEPVGEPQESLWFDGRFFQRMDDDVLELTTPRSLLVTALFPLALLEGIEAARRDGERWLVTVSRKALLTAAGNRADEVAAALEAQGLATMEHFEALLTVEDGLVHEIIMDIVWPDDQPDGLAQTSTVLRLSPTTVREIPIPTPSMELSAEDFMATIAATSVQEPGKP